MVISEKLIKQMKILFFQAFLLMVKWNDTANTFNQINLNIKVKSKINMHKDLENAYMQTEPCTKDNLNVSKYILQESLN